MYKKWLILVLTATPYPAKASTFIGNGGNAGDLDLSVTLAEIQKTFTLIDENSNSLCRCSDELAENDLCHVLRSLTAPQVKFCRDMLLKNAEVISALASKNSKVEFSWSDEPLSARSKDGDTRPVDGVTQSDDYKVILNRQRFLGMPHSFRIALVTHELFHLVPYGDTHITDSQVLPPFKDGRSLLDTLGAATAMAAYDQEVIDDFLYLNNVSRAYKKFVFQLDFKSVAHTKSAARKLLKNRRSSGTAFTFEYKPEDLGFRLGVESVGNSSNYMDALSVSEYLTLYSFGVGYHWFPLTARLSRWSELHLASFVDVLYGSARYRAGDDIFSLEDKGRAHGVQLTGQVSIPLVIGFWGLAGYQVRNIQYQYKTLNISTNELQQIMFLGGAYAF